VRDIKGLVIHKYCPVLGGNHWLFGLSSDEILSVTDGPKVVPTGFKVKVTKVDIVGNMIIFSPDKHFKSRDKAQEYVNSMTDGEQHERTHSKVSPDKH
jgi:hypothetical protein